MFSLLNKNNNNNLTCRRDYACERVSEKNKKKGTNLKENRTILNNNQNWKSENEAHRVEESFSTICGGCNGR